MSSCYISVRIGYILIKFLFSLDTNGLFSVIHITDIPYKIKLSLITVLKSSSYTKPGLWDPTLQRINLPKVHFVSFKTDIL
jgi:hypothetical protein